MKKMCIFYIIATVSLLIAVSLILLNFRHTEPVHFEYPEDYEYVIVTLDEEDSTEKKSKENELENRPPVHGDLSVALKYKHEDFPIAVVAYKRPKYLKKCLDSLSKVDHINMDNVTVFQQDFDEATTKVVNDFGLKLHQHPRQEKDIIGAAHITDHYGHIFGFVFNQENPPPHLIIVEEDMIFAPDFLDYFVQLAPIYEDDPNVWCISTWNDNAFSSRDRNPRRLDRTDFFIGLGWMITRKLFKTELEAKWPDNTWDLWMRLPEQRKGRECIYPESPRNYNIGVVGVHSGEQFYAKFFERVSMNQYHHVQLDYEALTHRNYELSIFKELKSAVIVEDLAMVTLDSPVPLIVFVDAESDSPLWVPVLRRFGLWFEIPVRGMHGGLLRFRWDRVIDNTVFLISNDSYYQAVFKPPGLQPFSPEAFTTLQLRQKTTKHTGSPLNIRLYTGIQEQSCTDVCAELGLSCEEDALFHINSCYYLLQHFSCDGGCRSSSGHDLPSVVVHNSTCLVQSNAQYYSCSGADQATRRLCPCRLKVLNSS